MNGRSTVATVGVVFLVALAGIAGSMLVTSQTTPSVTIDATPTDISDSESSHAVIFTVGATAGGETFNAIRVDYSEQTPSADVSNVGANSIERIGIDRAVDGDRTGTRLDENATINSVTGEQNGAAILIETNQNITMASGDEIIVVLRPVQNPQNGGTPAVNATLNPQSAAESATDSVTYANTTSNVTITNQTSDGTSVTVDSADLSEGGWVVVQNVSGENSNEIRGQTYVSAGSHSSVTVELDEPISQDQELWAQIYHDTNGDRFFNYTGGLTDRPYDDLDGNIQAADSAFITVSDATATPTSTATATATSTEDDDPDITNYRASADNGTITVSFDSDENLAEIRVNVSGPENATLETEDFSGNEYEGYTATYDASTNGDYTLELVTAKDSAGNDGADDGDFSDTATVDDEENGTASPTPTDGADGDTPTATDDDGTTGDDTPTPTDTEADDDTDDETPTDADDDTAPDDDDDETESPTEDGGAGFGGAIALTALLASALLFYRRR